MPWLFLRVVFLIDVGCPEVLTGFCFLFSPGAQTEKCLQELGNENTAHVDRAAALLINMGQKKS